jgi:DNA-nicking Smr family endonuclease
MTRRRSHRALSVAEEQLWREVVKFVRPMSPEAQRTLPAESLPIASARPPKSVPKAVDRPVPAPVPPRKKQAAPPLAPLERKFRRGLVRGHVDIDGRLDLHGMRQHEAHMALRRFLMQQHQAGGRLVIVVTGKGVAAEYDPEARGVLKRQLPQWLSALELRSIVVGFDQASDKHGGGGAFYVRLRSHRARERLDP